MSPDRERFGEKVSPVVKRSDEWEARISNGREEGGGGGETREEGKTE